MIKVLWDLILVILWEIQEEIRASYSNLFIFGKLISMKFFYIW